MATLKKYTNTTGYFVQHTFRAHRRLFHVTYQVSASAQAALEAKGFRDGSRIPRPLLHELIKSRNLFTSGSGAAGQAFEVKESGEAYDPFTHLTPESRKWVILRIFEHPAVRVRIQDLREDGVDTEVDSIPEGFFHQLIAVAQKVDGTDFIKNLDLSYRKPK